MPSRGLGKDVSHTYQGMGQMRPEDGTGEVKLWPAIAKWVEHTAERKASAYFDPADNKWDHHYAAVDVTGHSASVKIELSKDGERVYTDYLSLLKFDAFLCSWFVTPSRHGRARSLRRSKGIPLSTDVVGRPPRPGARRCT